jgi:hypothetical protein
MSRRKNPLVSLLATEYKQGGNSLYTISIDRRLWTYYKSGDVKFDMTLFDADKGEGFQRLVIPGKIHEISEYIEMNGILPGGPKVSFSEEPVFVRNKEYPEQGRLHFFDPLTIYFIDGQHNVGGWLDAMHGNDDLQYAIPAVGGYWDKLMRKVVFTVSNSNQTPIPKNLLIEQKVTIHREAGSLGVDVPLPPKCRSGVVQESAMMTILDLLNNRKDGQFKDNVWVGRIAPANTPAHHMINKGGRFYFNRGNMVSKYKCIAGPKYKDVFPEDLANKALCLNNLWVALSQLIPEAFGKTAKDYRLVWEYFSHQILGAMLPDMLRDMIANQIILPMTVPCVVIFHDYLARSRAFRPDFWTQDGDCIRHHGRDVEAQLKQEILADMGVPTKPRRRRRRTAA